MSKPAHNGVINSYTCLCGAQWGMSGIAKWMTIAPSAARPVLLKLRKLSPLVITKAAQLRALG